MKVIRLFFALAVAFVMAPGAACAQLWTWEDEIYFRLQNDSGRVIPGATVYLNGVKMEYSETCGNFADRTCYRCPKFDMDVRVHLSIQHPQYRPFTDSVNIYAAVRLLKPGDTNFFYNYVKVPCEPTPDTYVTTCGQKSDVADVRGRIEAAGGRIIDEFSQCGRFKQHEYGPYSLLYVLPRNDSTAALHRYLGRNFDTGRWLKQTYRAWALANHFRMHMRPAWVARAQQLLEQMKADSVIQYFSIIPASTITPAPLYQATIYLEKGDAEKVQPLIEQLLKTELFCDPVMEFYLYKCPD